MELFPKFDFVCSGKRGREHPRKVVLKLKDSRRLTRYKGKGRPIATAPMPEGTPVDESAIGNYYPHYVALTPYEKCYWINDEPPSRYPWRTSTPHAQLICPECGLIARLSADRASKILEAFAEKGSCDLGLLVGMRGTRRGGVRKTSTPHEHA